MIPGTYNYDTGMDVMITQFSTAVAEYLLLSSSIIERQKEVVVMIMMVVAAIINRPNVLR